MSPRDTRTAIFALGYGRPVRVRDALDAGITRSALRSALAAGAIIRVRHGCLLSARDSAANARDESVEQIQAAMSRLGADVVVSHASAALLHGLPLPHRTAFDQVHFLSLSANRRRYPGVKIHAAYSLDESDIVTVDGLRTTSVMRTAVDVARRLALPEALVPLDAAVRRLVIEHPGQRPELADHDRVEVTPIVSEVCADLAQWGDRLATCIGVRELRRAIDHVSPLAESPLESGSRGVFIDDGLMPLALQYRFVDATGTQRRADFLFAEGLIGEVDGLIKYEGADGVQRLRNEKLRDLACAEVGLRTVRWAASDVWVRPRELLRRIRREMAAFPASIPRMWSSFPDAG